MDLQAGCVVKSLAGHDKGQYYILLSDDGKTVTVADGKYKTIAAPKRKNKKHIQAEKEPLPAGGPLSDERIRRELKIYRKSHSCS